MPLKILSYDKIAETTCLWKKLFSSELEMKRNEFYYPGELLYAELFQLPTYSETVENKSTQFKTKNSNKKKGHMINELLIDWVRLDWTGKYLALG